MTFTGPYPTNFGSVTSAMLISATTFSGGASAGGAISNSGTISSLQTGIRVENTGTFALRSRFTPPKR